MKYTEQQKQIYNDVCDKYKHNWLNTTISQTMAMEMISKALNIADVSQQRELLKAYAELIQKYYTNHFFDDAIEESIDQFLSL